MARTKLNPDQMPLLTPDSAWRVPKELPDLRRVGVAALDTETRDDGLAQVRGPGWVYNAGYVCGVSMAWRAGNEIEKIYVPIRHPETENFPRENVARWLRDVLPCVTVKCFNAQYDFGWLQADLGVEIPPLIDDASCMAVMIDENRYSFGLEELCEERGLPLKDEQLLREAGVAYGIAPKDIKKNLWRLPARYVGDYAEHDALMHLLLNEAYEPEIERQQLGDSYRLEMDLVPMVIAMRMRGIRVDVDFVQQAKDRIKAQSQRALDELSSRLRMRVGLDEVRSSGWLVQRFSENNISYHMKEERASFEKDWMRQGYVGRYEEGREGHWLPLLVAEARQCNEFADKFLQNYVLDYAHRGRIHASINQFRGGDDDDGGTRGTRSHRFSYSDPPLQQAPSRPEPLIKTWTLTAELAAVFRQAFLPEEGEVWGALDYSQQEYRLIVHYASLLGCSRADEAVDKYVRDPTTDFHNLVVELTGLIRQRAKDCNFAKAFGAGIPKFAAMTGMSFEEAKSTMERYDGEMPFVRELAGKCEKRAQHRGFIKLLDGARSHFDEWEAAWLERDERDRGWREGYKMLECDLAEAQQRAATPGHPWHGKRLKRAKTHKAMNRLIQGGAARMTKQAMRECHRAGILPLIQMHDELGASFVRTDAGRRQAEQMRDIMRTIAPLRVPMLVDAEFGDTWGDAKHGWAEAVPPRAAKGRRAAKNA